MSWTAPDFEQTKANFLRISGAVEKARSRQELRALLMADVGAAHHSFNTLEMVSRAVNVTTELMESMCDDLDEDGVPK